jgi:putative ABC transport system ATP-binding protein
MPVDTDEVVMQPLLTTSNLTKTYQARGVRVPALRDVNIAVQRGEFIAVMGPSGCGKSTLLQLIGGLDRPTSGEILLEGERVDSLSEARRAVLRRKQIGFIFQFFNLVGNLTVADNVELPALLAGAPPAQARRLRERLLAELDIADKADRVPSELSGGEQQRVAIARALINRPALLLADEPTGNLNSQGTREVLALLSQYHAIGQTILLVSHDARVASAAERVIYMRDGSIKDETRMELDHDSRKVLSRMIQLEG